eukprot:6241350-Alexandrium_andersonii.AAC.1
MHAEVTGFAPGASSRSTVLLLPRPCARSRGLFSRGKPSASGLRRRTSPAACGHTTRRTGMAATCSRRSR